MKQFDNIPTHVALIMDGNRRWAARKGLSVAEGHRAAIEQTLRPIVERAIERSIPYITFWAFSTENRNRDKEELKSLFSIFRQMLKKHLGELEKEGVRIKIIGDIEWFPKDIAELAKSAVERTKDNKKITVSFALNYGGRDEIIRAVNKILRDKIQKSNINRSIQRIGNQNRQSLENVVSESEFANYLDTSGMPDPDLIIRTGGEKRLSGYLPWQSTYAELYFTDVYWPDFTPREFDKALEDYSRRNRRFGAGRFADYVRRKATEMRNGGWEAG